MIIKTLKKYYFFDVNLFGKPKKVIIFATAIRISIVAHWRNGRAVECGSLENC
jgi:hypothetical protein